MPSLRGFASPLRNPSLRAIWVSLLASSLGDWAARIALAILVLERTGSPAYSALVVAVSFIPWIGPGQILATKVAHLRRIPVMVTADLVRAAIYALLLVPLPVVVVIALAFVASLATPPFEASRSALTVEVVPEQEYGPALALLDITDQAAIVLGYLLGGIWVIAGGYQLALGANVASFLISALALSQVKERRGRQEATASSTQLRRGLQIIWGDNVIRRGLAVLLVAALPVAAIEATAATYARLVLHADASTTGELAAAVPLGIVVAIPFLPRSGGPHRLLRVASLTAVAGAVVGLVAFGVGALAGALIGFFGAGLLTGSVTPAQIAFQPRIPTEDRPGVFSVAQGLVMGFQGIGAAVGGVVAAVMGARTGDMVWLGVVVVFGLAMLAVPLRLHAGRGQVAAAPRPRPPASQPAAAPPAEV